MKRIAPIKLEENGDDERRVGLIKLDKSVMKKNRFIFLLNCIAVPLFLFSANSFANTKKIVIGHPACLSGKYAAPGRQEIGGIEACIDWVNNVYGGVKIAGGKVPLEYKYYDCESKKESVTRLIKRLITVDKVNVIFAAYSSGLTLHGAPITESHKMLYMDQSGASDKIFKQGFRYIAQTTRPATIWHRGTLDMIHKIDPEAKRLALAYEDSEFAKMVMDGAYEHAEKLGFLVVFKQTYPMGVTDMTPMLSALKASKPDFVLGGGHFEDGVLMNRQMADLEINVKALSLIASANHPAFYEALTKMAEGVMGPSIWEYGVKYSADEAKKILMDWMGPSQDEFVKFFKKAMGKDIIPYSRAAEAGAQVLAYVKAVETSGSLDSDKVRAALGKLKFMSFYGPWEIDYSGMQMGQATVSVQWQNRKRVIVWPKEVSTGKIYYPIPTFAEKDEGKVAVPK